MERHLEERPIPTLSFLLRGALRRAEGAFLALPFLPSRASLCRVPKVPGLAATFLATDVQKANARRESQFVAANLATSLFVVCHLLTVSPGGVVA